MSLLPTSPNADFQRLRDEGYDVSIRGNALVVAGVPYVNSERRVLRGALVSGFTLAGDIVQPPDTHVVKWAGEYPCHKDGRPIEQLRHAELNERIDGGLVVRYSFSNKPPTGPYPTHHAKLSRYADVISAPAGSLEPGVTAKTHPPVVGESQASVFEYLDTALGSAGTAGAAMKLSGHRIGIVGVGGTGSYVLDLVAKTPVAEIHLFDDDHLLSHNAFRAPGAATLDELRLRPTKVEHHRATYAKMRRGIVAHNTRVHEGNVEILKGLDFVFLCIDSGPTKAHIMDGLEALGIAFIDTGIGAMVEGDALCGAIRVTTSTPAMRCARAHIDVSEPAGGADYDRNVQVADLNALTASLAVMRWKRLCGFYHDHDPEFHATLTIDGNLLSNRDRREA